MSLKLFFEAIIKFLLGVVLIGLLIFSSDLDRLSTPPSILTLFIIAIVEIIISFAITPQIKQDTAPVFPNPRGAKIGEIKPLIKSKILV